jgi:hypothetical protein
MSDTRKAGVGDVVLAYETLDRDQDPTCSWSWGSAPTCIRDAAQGPVEGAEITALHGPSKGERRYSNPRPPGITTREFGLI